MIKIDLKDKNILLTGALGAISEFVIRRLIEAGALVYCTDILDVNTAREQLESWGINEAQSPYRAMDVTDPKSVEEGIQAIVGSIGAIDICLGHAGGCGMHPFIATSAEEYERIFRLNYFGQVHLTRSVLKHWLDTQIPGHMIYTSSLVAEVPWPDLTAYNSAKAAIQMFAKTLALENARHDIRFNVIAPGHVAAGSSLKVYNEDESYRQMTNTVIPLKRLVRPEAIADAFLWLCSTLADDVNGQVIKVDLGASIPKVGGDA